MISEQTAAEPTDKESEADPPDPKENVLPRPSQEIAGPSSRDRTTLQRQNPNYKNIPEDWKAIPPGRFRSAIGHLEAVLLEISADGTLTSNLFDWKPTIPTLEAWADHLRSAL
ncbi:MAG: hypothetical protein ACREQW_06300 [Candidatus Binatia bacterium]